MEVADLSRQKRLELEIESVWRRLDNIGARLRSRIEGSGDIADRAYELVERERICSRYSDLTQRRRQLEYAKERLEQGLGNLCEVCGGAIGTERTKAIVEATRCRACQQQAEQRVKRFPRYTITDRAA